MQLSALWLHFGNSVLDNSDWDKFGKTSQMIVIALLFSFTYFFLCKCLDLYLKFIQANLKTTLDLSIPVYGFLLKRLVVLA